MAIKQGLLLYIKSSLLYLCINTFLAILLLILRYECMDNDNMAFADGYCVNNSGMRAIISAILTIVVIVIGATVMNAVSSYRTYQLKDGINEGAFVAMAGNISYRWKSMKTKWRFVIMLIMVFQYGPESLQTLSNLAIKTVSVYVRNSSDVTIFDNVSYYNATGVSISPDLATSIGFISNMLLYSTGANSAPVFTSTALAVETSVIRDSFISAARILNGDSTNALKRDEVIATVSTSCTDKLYSNSLYNLSNDNIIQFSALGANILYLFSVEYTTNNNNFVVFNTVSGPLSCNATSTGSCTSSSSTFSGPVSVCKTGIDVALRTIIYTVSTKNIKVVNRVNNYTTVNINTMSRLILNYTISIEQASANSLSDNSDASIQYALTVINFLSSFGPGPFNTSTSNAVHSRYCAATSGVLNTLWNLYRGPGSSASGNDYKKYDKFIPLYNIKLQAYMPTYYAYIIFVLIILITLLVVVADVIYYKKSPINIKQINELCFLDNINSDFVSTRLAEGLSNNPSEQENFAFKAGNLYCGVYDDIEKDSQRLIVDYVKHSTPNVDTDYR